MRTQLICQYKLFGALVVTILFAFTATGQVTINPDINFNMTQIVTSHIIRENMFKQMRERSARSSATKSSGSDKRVAGSRSLSDKVKRGAGRGATRGSGAVRRGTTRFVSTAAPLMPARLAAELGRTPEERLQLERALSQMLAMSKRMMAEAGLAVDDVASGAQFAVLIGYRVRDEQEWSELVRRDDVQAAMVRAREVAAAELSGAEDERKQEEFERSVLMASVALGSYETGRRSGDERLVGQAKQLAAATLARWVR